MERSFRLHTSPKSFNLIGLPVVVETRMISKHLAEVRVRRYPDTPECDVVVFFREQTMVLKCRDYSQAVKWAHIECKSYKIPGDFTAERVEAQPPN